MSTRRDAVVVFATLVVACLVAALGPAVAGATTLQAGFSQTTAIAGLTKPMDVEIAPNGRIFVAEKSGIVKTYDSLADTTATVAADLRTQVHNFSSRGLQSIAVDPGFPAKPYIYVYYNLDAKIGGTPPLYGMAGVTNDNCAKAPLGKDENCVGSVRVSRLQLAGELVTTEKVLVEDYCLQYPVHSGGGLEFAADGYLYVSGSDGSTAALWDYGQTGTPLNPCGDPPGKVGTLLKSPTSEGGRLRVQDLRTPATAGDPTGLAGSLIRIDPATGAGAPNNPLKASKDANERRMIGYGLRDSVRLAVRPGTSEIWVTDRGGGYWEEFMRVTSPFTSVENFGYPCHEGGIDALGKPFARIRPASHAENLNICENLYKSATSTVAPYWGYDHELPVVPNEKCSKDALGSPAGSLLSGAAFAPKAGNYPALYKGALFFSDRLRDCIYALLPGADGLPQRGKVVQFAAAANRAHDIEFLPGGDMLYVDQRDNVVQRIAYAGTPINHGPTAVAVSGITTGVAPLIVAFDAAGSTDPDLGDVLTYEWDLDGDGAFDDSKTEKPTFTYTKAGTYKVQLRVKDPKGLTSIAAITITVNAATAAKEFVAEADARVEQDKATTNFGTQTSLLVRGGTKQVVESYLRFTVSGITGPISSAKLRLTAGSNGTVDGPALYTAPNTWTETAIKWTGKPVRGTTLIGDAAKINANATVDYDVKSVVSGNGTVTFVLVGGTSIDGVDFGSREQGTAAKRPRLLITQP